MTDFNAIERLVRFDIDDAFISERMSMHLNLNMHQLNLITNFHEAKGVAAIQRSLNFRFMMAVQRLLQGRTANTSVNIDAYLHSAQNMIECEVFRSLEARLSLIRTSAGAKTLHEARNLFMAHTRLHPRDGTERISNDDVLGTLFELADLVRDIHESATKEIITVDTKYYEYDNIATITWRKLLHNLLNDEV